MLISNLFSTVENETFPAFVFANLYLYKEIKSNMNAGKHVINSCLYFIWLTIISSAATLGDNMISIQSAARKEIISFAGGILSPHRTELQKNPFGVDN